MLAKSKQIVDFGRFSINQLIILEHTQDSNMLNLFNIDVVTIDRTGDYFRLLYDVKGRYTLHKITAEEAKVSCRIVFHQNI